MGQDLAHKRPWLLASLVAGISFPATSLLLPIEGSVFAIIWKTAAVGLLVPYVLRRHYQGEFFNLAVVLACYAIGDGLIEMSMIYGALAFAIGHIIAAWIYIRHRRVGATLSQKLFAITLLVLTPFIAFFLPGDPETGIQVAGYSVILSAMAACAWKSNFPRYRVGIGAVLFVISDLLIFARLGPLAAMDSISIAIWYLYYFGVLMIAVGIVQALVKRGHFASG
jgi:uncharacterized membrane protein YhhN